MHILGIETSCDDTGISILKIGKRQFKILSNVISSQVKIHQKYGGVYPSLAKREHQRNLPIVLTKALKKANFSISNFKFLISKKNPNIKISTRLASQREAGRRISKIDLVAVTVGPGLEPCLWTGINFAKELAKNLRKPIIPVNHIEAHILANFVGENSKFKIPRRRTFGSLRGRQNSKLFPAVCLVVSGGHTQLILMRGIGDYKLLGETRDDAAGECFDKTARILGLSYPGGPAIAKLEKNGRELFSTKLPRPMLHQKNYDFSFSGLKTAVLYDFQNRSLKEKKSKKYIQAMCFEIQQAIIDVLIYKTIKAAKDYRVKSIILGGGVAANDELRKQFKTACLRFYLKHFVPPKKFCTDNAAMIALTAFFHQKKATMGWQKIKANANLHI